MIGPWIKELRYDGMPYLKPEIVYPFNRQYSMSAAKVCWVNSVGCNLLYHIISTIEIYLVIELSGGPIRAGGCKSDLGTLLRPT